MMIIQTFELIIRHIKKCRVKEESGNKMLHLFTFCLWFSTSLGGYYDSPENSYYISQYADKYKANKECVVIISSYIHQLHQGDCVKFLADCFNTASDSVAIFSLEGNIVPSKREVVHKNIALFPLKLNRLSNVTTQLGFLTSGRFRRVTGNTGTEFLGKRLFSAKDVLHHPASFKSNFGKKVNIFFFTNKFSDPTSLKQDGKKLGHKEWKIKFFGKRMGNLDNEKIKLLLGNQITKLDGSELLGKRSKSLFEGSEFLGKRNEK